MPRSSVFRSDMNIYEMYVQEGNRCGFWVRRNSWTNNIARVTSIAGKFGGELARKPPYFGNPKVRGDIYLEATGEMRWNVGGSGRNMEITAAGTGGYVLVPTPAWWKEP